MSMIPEDVQMYLMEELLAIAKINNFVPKDRKELALFMDEHFDEVIISCKHRMEVVATKGITKVVIEQMTRRVWIKGQEI